MIETKKIKIGIGTFDLSKGFAIALVVFSHSVSRYTIDDFGLLSPVFYVMNTVGIGFMPMFFIISGYGIKRKPFVKVLKKTFSELIIPYLIAIPIAIVCYALFYSKIANVTSCIESIGSQFISFLLCTDAAGPLWFFIALFIATNLLNLILNTKNETLRTVFVSGCVLLGFILMRYEVKVFRMVQGLTAVGYCYVGYVIKEKRLLERSVYSIWTYLLLIPIWLVQAVSIMQNINGCGSGAFLFDMQTGAYSLVSFFVSGCTGILLLHIGVLCSKVEWKCFEYVRELGVYSYWILIVHTIESHAVPWYHIFVENSSIYFAFIIEICLKVLFIALGCSILKKITQFRYQRVRRMNPIRVNDNAVK